MNRLTQMKREYKMHPLTEKFSNPDHFQNKETGLIDFKDVENKGIMFARMITGAEQVHSAPDHVPRDITEWRKSSIKWKRALEGINLLLAAHDRQPIKFPHHE